MCVDVLSRTLPHGLKENSASEVMLFRRFGLLVTPLSRKGPVSVDMTLGTALSTRACLQKVVKKNILNVGNCCGMRQKYYYY